LSDGSGLNNELGDFMKASKLAEILLQNPDFDVRFTILDKDDSEWGLHLRVFNIGDRLPDIGYSDKIISISGVEEE